MPTTPFSKVPYPSGSDAPAAAADMMAAFMSMDDRLVLKAEDEADRNSRYYDAPVSSLVVSGRSQKIWVKTGSGATDWAMVLGDTGWISEGFVAQSGWEINKIQARNRNGNINIRGDLNRTGDRIDTGSTGNFTDVDVVSVPPNFRPEGNNLDVIGVYRSPVTSGASQLYSHGMVRILDGHSNSAVREGDFVRLSFSYLGA